MWRSPITLTPILREEEVEEPNNREEEATDLQPAELIEADTEDNDQEVPTEPDTETIAEDIADEDRL
jgi:hypothetical protein